MSESSSATADVSGRWIGLCAGTAAENMAIDQALLESVDAGGRPVMRFYTWREPTLSLGYFQPIAQRQRHSESSGLTCVRRATGGGAIVHHLELTYSIAIPIATSTAGARMDLYRQTHLAAANALSHFGIRAVPFRLSWQELQTPEENPFLCFQRRTDEDLIVSGYKVLGSAQRKARHAVLQHGSLLLRSTRWAPQLPGVCDLTSRPVPLDQFAETFASKLAESLAINWTEGEISSAERLRAQKLTEKFMSDRWVSRR